MNYRYLVTVTVDPYAHNLEPRDFFHIFFDWLYKEHFDCSEFMPLVQQIGYSRGGIQHAIFLVPDGFPVEELKDWKYGYSAVYSSY